MGKGLGKGIRFWDAVAINVGIVIGVGIFRVPSEVAQILNSSWLILLAWLLGGVLTLLGVFCYAELASRFPQTGGTYIYIREAYGKMMGFLFGWIEVTMIRAGSLAALAYIFVEYLNTLFPENFLPVRLQAMVLVFFFTILNFLKLQVSVGVQNVLTVLKVGSVILLVALIIL